MNECVFRGRLSVWARDLAPLNTMDQKFSHLLYLWRTNPQRCLLCLKGQSHLLPGKDMIYGARYITEMIGKISGSSNRTSVDESTQIV